MSDKEKDLIVALIYAYRTVFARKLNICEKNILSFPTDEYLMGKKHALEECYNLCKNMFEDIYEIEEDLIVALIYAYRTVLLNKTKLSKDLKDKFQEDDYLRGQFDAYGDCWFLWKTMFEDIDD